MDVSTNPAYIAFAAFAPLLIAFIKQSGFSTQTNAMIALGSYIVIGIVAALASGMPFTFESIVPMITVAVVVGRSAYSIIWSNIGRTTGLGRSLDEALTQATSIIK